MIIRLIILALLFVLQQMVNLLPVGSLPIGVYTSLTTATSYLSGWESVFPISTLLQVLGLTLAFQLTMWGWNLSVWVYGRIRGVSNR